MRVIAGRLGGRQFDSPKSSKTHPMSEKMRGALFNSLGDITNLIMLDAFAGSGALGFEALSRGVRYVTFIESDTTAQKVIAQNIKSLEVKDHTKLIKAKVATWLQTSGKGLFDVTLVDPPYDDLQTESLRLLAHTVKPQGIMVVSYPGDLTQPQFLGLELLRFKLYGDGQLVFYRRIS